MSRRILDETTKSTFASDDYLYMDGQTNGSSKITPDNLVRNTTVAQQLAQHIADAEDEVEQITADIEGIQTDINDVKADIGDLADLDTTDKSSLVAAINEAKSSGGTGVPSAVRQAMLTLFESAAYAETGLTDEIAIVESWAEAITEITLNQSAISISGASTSQLVTTTVPAGGTVTWTSSDTSVATVSASGLVTGVGNGTATITASCGGLSARCTATVSGFATLTSISAVYTQSGTVYDTDSLDDLKSDLVVTATYSDDSTETVTSYILSGNLTESTSTITVAYGGKTATFNVAVTFPYYDWDLTDSIIDKNHNLAFTATGVAQVTNDGLVIDSDSTTSSSWYGNIIANNAITVGDHICINVAEQTPHLMEYNNGTKGSIYHYGNGAIFFIGTMGLQWRGTSDEYQVHHGAWSALTATYNVPAYFSEKSIIVDIDNDGIATISCDGETLWTSSTAIVTSGNYVKLQIGATDTTQSFRKLVVSSIAVYR